jgi:succinate dehydrogenase/fumarate reductase iron-sulfur protein
VDAKIIAKVFRYDPTVDDEPYYMEYEVPWQDDPSGFMTGLQVLNYIYENIDPIAYDYNCRGGLCGRCSMVINGKPGLACYTPLKPGNHVFEPLESLPMIKDLIIDRKPYTKRFVESSVAKKTINPVTKSDDIDYKLYWETLEVLNNCSECMCCYDVCPALDNTTNRDFIGPAAMMQVALRHFDPHDDADRIEQAVHSGLWDCIMCGRCDRVCPSKIPISKTIRKLKTEAESRGMKPTVMTWSNGQR